MNFVLLFLAFLALSSTALGLDYVILDGKITASEGDETVWENCFATKAKLAAKSVYGPVLAGGRLYYSAESLLWDVDPESGVVNRTISLPGLVRTAMAEGDRLVLEVGSSLPVYTWMKTYTVTPAGHDIPFTLPGSIRAARLPQAQALAVVETLLETASEAGEIDAVPSEKDWKAEGPFIPLFEKAETELARLAERDPTNPWLPYLRGKLLSLLGRREESLASFRLALAVPPEYRFRLLGLVFRLDEHDTALGDEAFHLALEDLIAKGFEPELMHALISLMIFYGRPLEADGKALDPEKDLDRMNALGDRLWDLAPLAEAVCFVYHGLAIYNEKAGNADLAATWRARRDASHPYRVFGGANRSAERTGHALTFVAASGIALWLFLIVTLFRNGSTFHRTPKKRAGHYNIFAYWTKPELAGFLALSLLGIYGMIVVHRGVSAISYSATAPISSFNGTWGHPDTLEFLEKARGTEGGDFLYALALQEMGDDEAAGAILAGQESARALNNRGVAADRAGDAEKAREFYRKALDADPDLSEARFNLGEKAQSPRIRRMVKYGGARPLLAMPTVDHWSEAWAAPSAKGSFINLLKLQSLANTTGTQNPSKAAAGLVSTALFVFVSSLILIALFQPTLGKEYAWRTPSSLVAWGLGFLVPGAARQWTFLGPFVLAFCAFSYIVARVYSASQGVATNFLEAICTPHVLRAFAFGEVYHSPAFAFVVGLRHLWWILLIVNAVFLAVMALVRPDPVGATGNALPDPNFAAPAREDETAAGEGKQGEDTP
jgi:tetratricopeptide (TPR) repeat protein